MFTLRRWTSTREAFTAQFELERRVIAGLYCGRNEDTLRRPVIIPRLRGLEDSSRFWSVYMTLDHAANRQHVDRGGHQGIDAGARTAGPGQYGGRQTYWGQGPEVITPYEASCDGLLSEVAAHPVLKTPNRFAHPWFGPLDAAGWHAPRAIHMGIHRAQIETYPAVTLHVPTLQTNARHQSQRLAVPDRGELDLSVDKWTLLVIRRPLCGKDALQSTGCLP